MKTDSEIRHLAISLLRADTARDKQRRIGASNLANGCAFCLACAFLNIARDTPVTDRAWGGKTLGTAIHGYLERNMNAAREAQAEPATLFTRVGVEEHVIFGVMGTYGPVGGTADLTLDDQLVDWKGTDKKKLAILVDYIFMSRGLEAPYGRKHAAIKLSEVEYAKEMEKVAYKVTGYYSQLQTYMWGFNQAGRDIKRGSIVFVARDDTMWYDTPGIEGYEDPTRTHGIYVLSFDYNERYALNVWERGLTIWEGLDAGMVPTDFDRHPLCFPCSLDARDMITAAPLPIVDETYDSALAELATV